MGGYHTELTGVLNVEYKDTKIHGEIENIEKIKNFRHIYGILFINTKEMKCHVKINIKRGYISEYVDYVKQIVEFFEIHNFEISGRLNLHLPDYDEDNYHRDSYELYNGNDHTMFKDYVEIENNIVTLITEKKVMTRQIC